MLRYSNSPARGSRSAPQGFWDRLLVQAWLLSTNHLLVFRYILGRVFSEDC
jgi:hypothetical protein